MGQPAILTANIDKCAPQGYRTLRGCVATFPGMSYLLHETFAPSRAKPISRGEFNFVLDASRHLSAARELEGESHALDPGL
jgi:hypothetical protein